MSKAERYLAALSGADGNSSTSLHGPDMIERERRNYLRNQMLMDFEDRIKKIESFCEKREGWESWMKEESPQFTQTDVDAAYRRGAKDYGGESCVDLVDAAVKAEGERIWGEARGACGGNGSDVLVVNMSVLNTIINNEADDA